MPLANVTITDKQDLLGQGVHAEIDMEVAYIMHRAKAATWGYRGGAPAEPEYIEIGSIKVENAPQSLENDLIEFYGDEIETNIMEQLTAEAEGMASRDPFDY